MSLLEIILLSLLQGLTEFLPISSSAHLILPAQLLGWHEQGLAFDIAVHLGSLLAVVLYFRLEVMNLLVSWWRSIFYKEYTKESNLAWMIILATIPAVIMGLLLGGIIDSVLRSIQVIAFTTVVFGLLLWYADVKGVKSREEYSLTFKQVLIIGLAQAVALIPGTSRSGITMTAGLLLGLTQTAAARFSFLLSIPVISLAAVYMSAKLVMTPEIADWSALGLGVVFSFAAAYFCIHFFLKIISKIGMLPFVIYRLCLGAVLWLFFV